jgi:hypothetical protein
MSGIFAILPGNKAILGAVSVFTCKIPASTSSLFKARYPC